MGAYLQEIAKTTVFIDLFIGSFLPLILVVMLTKFFGENRSIREGLGVWKFALFAGFSFTIPAFLVATFLGPEFPSIIGGLVGLAIVVPAAKKGFLLPDDTWYFSAEDRGLKTDKDADVQYMPLIKAWMPYILVALFLVLTRLQILPLKDWLTSVEIGMANIFGTDISTSFEPLYLPGSIFIVVIIITAFYHKMSRDAIKTTLLTSSKSMVGSVIALGAAVPMVRIFINSGLNGADLMSMPMELATSVANLTGGAWPLVAPIIGSLGSFISGSATFSNMMFSLFQFSVADQIGVEGHMVVALQVLGSNAGNMVCVLNVVAAASVVNKSGEEGSIIRITLIPMTIYVAMAGLLGMVFIYLL